MESMQVYFYSSKQEKGNGVSVYALYLPKRNDKSIKLTPPPPPVYNRLLCPF